MAVKIKKIDRIFIAHNTSGDLFSFSKKEYSEMLNSTAYFNFKNWIEEDESVNAVIEIQPKCCNFVTTQIYLKDNPNYWNYLINEFIKVRGDSLPHSFIGGNKNEN